MKWFMVLCLCAVAGVWAQSPPVTVIAEGWVGEFLALKISGTAAPNASDAQTSCNKDALQVMHTDGLARVLGGFLNQSDGGAAVSQLLRENPGIQQGAIIRQCCSLSSTTGQCATQPSEQTWEQCLCAGVIRYPGGPWALNAALKRFQ